MVRPHTHGHVSGGRVRRPVHARGDGHHLRGVSRTLWHGRHRQLPERGKRQGAHGAGRVGCRLPSNTSLTTLFQRAPGALATPCPGRNQPRLSLSLFASARQPSAASLQGYLAHKKLPPPRNLQ